MSEISTRWAWFLGIAICSGYAFSANCALAQFNNLERLGNIFGLDGNGIEAKRFFLGGFILLNLLDTSCNPDSRQRASSFVITGRGGLPMSPIEPLQDTSTLSTWVRLRLKPANAKTIISPQPTAVLNTTKVAAAIPIVEATSWIIDRNGNIELVAQVPSVTPYSSSQTPASCPASH